MNYSRKLFWKAILKSYGLNLLIFIIGIILLIYFFFKAPKDIPNISVVIVAAIFFYMGFFIYPPSIRIYRWFNKIDDKLMDQADKAKKGIKGEKTVSEWLNELLVKDKYKVFNNYVIPQYKSDIDFVVIGPKGIVILEVKNFKEKVKFYNDKFFLLFDNHKVLLPPAQDPRTQLNRNTNYLSKYFKINGFGNVRIYKAVVFINKEAVQIGGNTGTFIASGFEGLQLFFSSLRDDPAFTPEYCMKIIRILEMK